jgi:hypothetical protein
MAAINYDSENDLIVISPEGKFNVSDARQMMQQCKTLTMRSKSAGCIIDFSNVEVVTKTFKMFDFESEFNKHGLNRSVKIAIVARHGYRAHKFFEVLARKRGFNVTAFNDMISAKNWMLKDLSLNLA